MTDTDILDVRAATDDVKFLLKSLETLTLKTTKYLLVLAKENSVFILHVFCTGLTLGVGGVCACLGNRGGGGGGG